ncbi:hypothetical protein KY290_001047 [Solanum tuberosum]|uniref:Uncharacterized protein n=1 Tax=Solanum tuberosum TaxID=4113 RepID=A0ABQ7WL26_SOLTU|nr:hypothetical protein KY290_001047 [Solanum tuberosum]
MKFQEINTKVNTTNQQTNKKLIESERLKVERDKRNRISALQLCFPSSALQRFREKSDLQLFINSSILIWGFSSSARSSSAQCSSARSSVLQRKVVCRSSDKREK